MIAELIKNRRLLSKKVQIFSCFDMSDVRIYCCGAFLKNVFNKNPLSGHCKSSNNAFVKCYTGFSFVLLIRKARDRCISALFSNRLLFGGFLQTPVSLMRQVMWVYKVKADRQSDEVRGHLQGIKTNRSGVDGTPPGRGQVFDRGNNAGQGLKFEVES